MKALIDGDIVVYRCAASAEHDEVWVACARADDMIRMILEDTGSDSYAVFLTGEQNFRRELAPSYKANRPDSRPAHWQAVRDYLVTQHKAVLCNGHEADDELGIHQDKTGLTTVICSIDKDLHQIPGLHYNFVKKEVRDIMPEEGLRFLYLQALIGDTSDNIRGVEGIGPVKAAKWIPEGMSESEMYHTCLGLYLFDEERLLKNLALLHIWQHPHDHYIPPHQRDSARDPSLPDEASSLDGELTINITTHAKT